MFRRSVVLFMLLSITGCASLCKNEKTDGQLKVLNESVLNKDTELQKKDELIEQLQKTVYQLEEKLKDRDSKISALRNKLKGFGVFE